MRGGKGCVGQEWDLRRVQVLPTDIPLNVRTRGLAEGRLTPSSGPGAPGSPRAQQRAQPEANPARMIWALACQRIPLVSRFCKMSLDPLGELVSIGQWFLWWSWFNRFIGLVDPQKSQWILGGVRSGAQ